ncbi:MAG: PorT family protein [Bacteroidales bacterium]|nr:PorT family protein [Bacteroidales bacterium]
MRKLIFFVAVLIVSLNVNAQKIGVKGGLNLSNTVTDDPSGTYHFKPGINASMFFQKSFVSFFSIRPEIGYYQKGGKNIYSTFLGEVTKLTTLNYLQFGVDARFRVPFIPIYVLAGPYGAYALSGENEIISGVKTEIDFAKDKTVPYDFGLAGGVGFIHKFTVLTFFVEFKYEMGMVDTYGYSSQTFVKNRNLIFSTGVMIGL